MKDFFVGLLGCSILITLPVLAGITLSRFHRRLRDLESQLRALQGSVDKLTPREAPGAEGSKAKESPAATSPPRAYSKGVPAPVPMPAPETMPAPVPMSAPVPISTNELTSEDEFSPKIGLEERLLGRLPVWVGSAAMVLAAAAFIKLTIDRGILTPSVRVILGVFAGLILLALGEFLRQRSRYVAQGLSASGIAALFIAFFAAANLYQLIPAAVGFVLMALTTATAVILALRQGILVAAIGLVGGFLTPMLVSGGEPRPGLLFSYLLMLQLGLVAVSRRRRWWHLAGLTLGAAFLWALFWLSGPFQPEDAAWIGVFLLSSAAIYTGTLAFSDDDNKGWGHSWMARGLGFTSMGGALLLLGGLAGEMNFGSLEWLFLGLLSAGCLVLGRLRQDFHGLAWLSAAFVTLMLAAWSGGLVAMDAARLCATLTSFTVLFGGGAYLAHHRSPQAARWACLAAVVGIAHFVIASSYGSRVDFAPIPWGAVALVLAAVYAAAAWPLLERRREEPQMAAPIAAFLVGATTLISLAVVIELERQWLTVAWALEVPVLMWLAGHLQLPALRKMAGILTSFVSVRLLLNPAILEYPIAETPIFNGLLLGYGAPLAAMVASYVLAQQQQAKRLSQIFAGVSLAFLVALVTVQIRHFFHGHLNSDHVLLAELATCVIAWLLLTLGMFEAARRLPEDVADWSGRILLIASIVLGGLGLGLGANPLLSNRAVGEIPLFNLVLYAYGIPAALLVVLSVVFSRRGAKILASVAATAGLVTTFLGVTLEVRQAFHGNFLDQAAVTNGENYTYSFAWIVLGTALMITGVMRDKALLRYAALAVMVPAVFKVFLYDTRQLEGFLRVLSLLGLGGSLFLLAFLYQRFVVQRQRERQPDSADPTAVES